MFRKCLSQDEKTEDRGQLLRDEDVSALRGNLLRRVVFKERIDTFLDNECATYRAVEKPAKLRGLGSVFDHFKVGKILGRGRFGVVRECTHFKSHEKFALKIINKPKCNGRKSSDAYRSKRIESVVTHTIHDQTSSVHLFHVRVL